MKRALILATVLAALACGDSFGPATGLDGSWLGNDAGIIMQVTLEENNNLVSGTGVLSGAGPTVDAGLAGSHTGTNVSLVISPEGFAQFQFDGTYDGCTIDGEITGLGNTPIPYALERNTQNCTPAQ